MIRLRDSGYRLIMDLVLDFVDAGQQIITIFFEEGFF